MFSVYVEASLMEDRLDAGFYRPDYLTLSKHLVDLGGASLNSLVDGVECGPFGGNAIADDLYAEQGIAFIRPVNISSHTFDDSCLVRVPRQVLLDGNLKIYDGTNLYFGRVGDPCVALIEGETSISPNIIVAKTNNNKADPYYLYAFAASSFGLNQLLRQLKTVAQPTTSTQAVKSLIIYRAQAITQQYIGDKVRQAEQLRAWAKARLQEITRLTTNEELNAACKTPLVSYNRPQLQDLSSRLDPKYYGNRAIAVEHQIKVSGKSLGSLIKDISNGFEERNFVTEGIDYITVSEVSTGRLDLSNAPKIPTTTGVPDKAQIHERCVLVVRTGSIGTAVKVKALDKGAVISSHLIRLEFADEATAASVAAFLNSEAGKILQHKISYGAVQPQIGQEELLALPIPQFILDKKEQILISMEAYESAVRCAKSLITTAKLLVEALIEGQLTEQQLINAQQQLETGDHSADQTILSRLKTDRFDGNGPALFNNFGQLYTLLEQAKKDSWMLAA